MNHARLTLWLCLALCSSALSQILPFDIYTTAHGLPSNWITQLYQDARGYLWIATSEGLAVYDGAEFKTYTILDGLPTSFVWCVTESRVAPGTMYIGTTNGLAKFEEGQFRSMRCDTSHDANIIGSIVTGARGQLWLGTNAGLYEVRHDSAFKVAALPQRMLISQVCVVDDSLLYVSSEAGLYLLNTQTGKSRVLLAAQEHGDPTFACAVDAEKNVWAIGKNSMLYQIRGDEILGQRRFPIDPAPWGALWILSEKEGELLVGDQNGFNVLARAGWEHNAIISYTSENGLPDTGLGYGLVDREHNLWLTSTTKGLFKLAERNLYAFNLPGTTFSAMNDIAARAANGRLFIALNSGLQEIWQEPSGSWQKKFHPLPAGAQAGLPLAVHVAAPGELWVAYNLGDLYRFRYETVRDGGSRLILTNHLRRRKELPDGHFVGGMFDRAGRYWCSFSDASVVWIDPKTCQVKKFFTPKEGLPSNTIRALCQDTSGNFWMGSINHGLSVFRLENERLQLVRRFTTANGLPDNQIRALYARANGEIWIGTRFGGALIWRDEHFLPLTVKEGLESNAIWGFAEDQLGRMWIATSLGAQIFDAAALPQLRTPAKLFGKRLNSIGSFNEKHMWAIDAETASFYDYVQTNRTLAPPVYITGVRISGKTQPLQSRYECNSAEDLCEISFAGISFRDEKALRYQYRLNAGDAVSAWQEPTEQRVVTYAALQPGTYHFEVRAMNGEGAISPQPAKIQFYIAPPLWQRWWFVSSALLVLIALVLGLERMRVRRLLEIEKIRSRIATDLHDDIGAGLTHIGLLSEITLRQYHAQKTAANAPSAQASPAQIEDAIARMGHVARELSAAMSDVVWSINPKHDSLAALLHRLTNFATEICKAQNIALQLEVDDKFTKLKLNPEVRRSLLLLAKEALHNLTKYSASPSAKVRAGVAGKTVYILIEDHGRGFDVLQATRGNGLTNMRMRAEKLGGTCEVTSAVGHGTTVHARIPIE